MVEPEYTQVNRTFTHSTAGKFSQILVRRHGAKTVYAYVFSSNNNQWNQEYV